MSRRPPMEALVAAALDPVMVGTPFGSAVHPGVGGRKAVNPSMSPWPRENGVVVWCADYHDLQREYPGLPQSHDQEDEPEQCVDLVLAFDDRGCLVGLSLEDWSLGETLDLLGLDEDARLVRGMMGRTAEEVCVALAGPLTRLLGKASAS